MAMPDTDYLLALRLQLKENGAGDFNEADALCLETHGCTSQDTIRNLALAHTLEASDQQVANDIQFARKLAATQHGLNPDKPKSNLEQGDDTVECQICFDAFFHHDTVAVQECNDNFCYPCFIQYMRVVIQKGHPYPVTCPSCRTVLDNQTCLKALSGTGQDFEAFERLIINKDHTINIRFCANPKCAVPFDWVRDGAAGANDVEEMARILCPICDTETCAICRCVWHEDQTCEENVLARDVESLSLLTRENNWTRCPDCGHLIEKRDGDCAFVRCTCGCGFCYSCGTAYLTLEATSENVHGRPRCDCSLFPPVDAEQVPPQLPQDDPVLPQRLQRYLDLVFAEPVHHGITGPNGHVNVGRCLEEDGSRMGGPLPQAMLKSLRENTCPYEDCQICFRDVRALEQHLAFVQRHEVYLCCGRPFFSYASLHNHQINNHAAE